MKKKILLIVVLGMSITPDLFAGSLGGHLGQLKSSEIAPGGFICGKSLDSSKSSSVVVEAAVSSKSNGSSAKSAK